LVFVIRQYARNADVFHVGSAVMLTVIAVPASRHIY
jgi:hypothetical protein